MNLNKAMIIGNLTRDPEVRTTPNGQTVASFGVATNLIWNDQSGQKQEKVEFHNIVAWRKLGEICGQYLKKGAKVYIEGRLQTSDWVGQDSVKRYKTEIVTENMIMLDRAGGGAAPAGGGSNFQSNTPSEPVIDQEVPVNQGDQSNPSEEDIKVENIPFSRREYK
jgi:single-strand DNA-binding protein